MTTTRGTLLRGRPTSVQRVGTDRLGEAGQPAVGLDAELGADRGRPLHERPGAPAPSLEEQELGGPQEAVLVERLGLDAALEQADGLVDVPPIDRVVDEQVEQLELPAAQPLPRRGRPVGVAVLGQQLACVGGQRRARQTCALDGLARQRRAGIGLEADGVHRRPLGQAEAIPAALHEVAARRAQTVEQVAQARATRLDIGARPEDLDGLLDGEGRRWLHVDRYGDDQRQPDHQARGLPRHELLLRHGGHHLGGWLARSGHIPRLQWQHRQLRFHTRQRTTILASPRLPQGIGDCGRLQSREPGLAERVFQLHGNGRRRQWASAPRDAERHCGLLSRAQLSRGLLPGRLVHAHAILVGKHRVLHGDVHPGSAGAAWDPAAHQRVLRRRQHVRLELGSAAEPLRPGSIARADAAGEDVYGRAAQACGCDASQIGGQTGRAYPTAWRAATIRADIVPFSGPPTYCDYRAKYTPYEKKVAEQYRRQYTDDSIAYAEVGTGAGATAFVLGGSPDPTVSKAGSIYYTVLATYSGFSSTYMSRQAEYMARIVADPPDPAWRRTARPLHISPNRIPTFPGASRSAATAIRSYALATLQGAAVNTCVVQAIDRGSTALAHGAPGTAAAQYRAGRSCALQAASVAARLPRLARKAAHSLAQLERRVVTRKVRHLLEVAPRGLAARRAAARRIAAAVARVIALPPSQLANLRKTLASTSARPSSVTLPTAFMRIAARNAKWASFGRRAAGVLAAAAARYPTVGRRATVAADGGTNVSVGCAKSQVACAGQLAIGYSGAHPSTLGSASFSVPAGKRSTVRLALSGDALRLLRTRRGVLRASSILTLTQAQEGSRAPLTLRLAGSGKQ